MSSPQRRTFSVRREGGGREGGREGWRRQRGREEEREEEISKKKGMSNTVIEHNL